MFVDVVRRMRAAQKAYFRERTEQHLQAAMAAEREVDKELARLADVAKRPLFGDPENPDDRLADVLR